MRVLLLAALLFATSASAQAGLVGRWRAVADAQGVDEVTFRADGTGEMRLAARTASAYTLAGAWAAEPNAERPVRLRGLTFTVDSPRVAFGTDVYYRADGGTLRMGSDPDERLMGTPAPYFLDGDRLALKLRAGFCALRP